MQEVSR